MRRMSAGWTVMTVACTALLVSVTGCTDQENSSASVSSAAVIGNWSGDCGATLDIAKGGHFTFADFPSGEGAHDERRLSGDGRWYLYRGGKGAPPPSLDLKYDNTLLSLYFTHSSDGSLAGMSFEEEDRTCSFTRER
ncbi:hypothetical protein GCM10010129_44020 [Streptomyces fumigatiscleroticus]|nr:hypothetical protein GCM10010129_44020 [Streptomyces fumigatiscleroticus]